MQVFVPETWQHFYFNPTLSPFKVPFVLSVFLMSLWLFVIVLLAVLDDLFRQLSPEAAVFYLLGLASCCIFCYFFFILTTHIYIGYLFIAVFVWVFFRKLRSSLAASRYRCGNCGQKIGAKGFARIAGQSTSRLFAGIGWRYFAFQREVPRLPAVGTPCTNAW